MRYVPAVEYIMLQIDYVISDSSNRYAFVSDLSNWNNAVFPARRKEWIKRTGKLTPTDAFMLERFGAIHKASDPLFFLTFSDSRYPDPWRMVGKKIGPQKTRELKNILDYFATRFQRIWETEKPKLERLRKIFIQKDIAATSTVKSIACLCGIKEKKPQRITCLLGMSAASVPDCNGWTSGNNIVLECSGWPAKRMKEIYQEIIPHELFHILLRNNGRLLKNLRELAAENESLLAKINFEGYSSRMAFEEITLSSFIPEGYLIHKKINPARRKLKDFQAVRKRFAYLLRDEAKKYVTTGKPIDKAYLGKAMSEIKGANVILF
jgi:hypothetical protein